MTRRTTVCIWFSESHDTKRVVLTVPDHVEHVGDLVAEALAEASTWKDQAVAVASVVGSLAAAYPVGLYLSRPVDPKALVVIDFTTRVVSYGGAERLTTFQTWMRRRGL